MVIYQYSYFIGSLALLAIWLFLFFWRKDLMKQLLIISFSFGLAGLIMDPLYASDMWFPKTITNTMPGIESFLFGFAVAGIASVAYIEIFSKRIRGKRATKKANERKKINFWLIGLLVPAIFFVSYFLFNLGSFRSSFPALLIPVLIIYLRRKDLIIDSIASATILTITSFLFYIIPELITPGWIDSTWNFNMLSGIKIIIVPIEDVIWYFLAGLLIGPLYEFWQEEKLVKYFEKK